MGSGGRLLRLYMKTVKNMMKNSAFHHTYIQQVWRSLSTQAPHVAFFSSQVTMGPDWTDVQLQSVPVSCALVFRLFEISELLPLEKSSWTKVQLPTSQETAQQDPFCLHTESSCAANSHGDVWAVPASQHFIHRGNTPDLSFSEREPSSLSPGTGHPSSVPLTDQMLCCGNGEQSHCYFWMKVLSFLLTHLATVSMNPTATSNLTRGQNCASWNHGIRLWSSS